MNKSIKNANDLITSHEAIRAGFLKIALEKNRLSSPYISEANIFKELAKCIPSPNDFLEKDEFRPFLISAAGLSEKSLKFLNENDKTEAIKNLIDKYLIPAGPQFIDEVIYRYLLVKGDALGGQIRNRVGSLGEEVFLRKIISYMNVKGIEYYWLESRKQAEWIYKSENDLEIERNLKALYWKNSKGDRVLALNLKLPIVGKNIDLCLFDSNMNEFSGSNIRNYPDKGIMFGELKGGYDPAGADEHWKTANTALSRIRDKFNEKYSIHTSFVGAAIEKAMAEEIFMQLQAGTLSKSANLTKENQMVEYVEWLLEL